MNDMFSDIEKKLKDSAKFTFICDVVFAVVILVGCARIGMELSALLVAAIYMSIAIAKVQILYGFAELITCTKDIRNSITCNPQATSMVDELPEL